MDNAGSPTECASHEWSICLPGGDTHQRSKWFIVFASFRLLQSHIWQQEPAYTSKLFICLFPCLTSLGLPGCDGGGVLRRGGGCALPLPLLHPGSLCLHCHAVCHSQGMETNCLQVSLFSARLPAWAPSFPHPASISMQHHMYCIRQLLYVCEYFLYLAQEPRCFATNTNFNCGSIMRQTVC